MSTINRYIKMLLNNNSHSSIQTSDSGLNHHVTRADWLDLPDDLLHYMSDKLVPFRDYIRFGAVCKLWQSAYVEGSRKRVLCHQRQFPFLLLPTEVNRDGQTRTLYDIVEKRSLDSQVQLPHSEFCVGSSHGWLLIVSKTYDVYLLNPFLPPPANQIHLPSLLNFPTEYEYDALRVDYLRGVELSHNPTLNPTSFLVMVIYSTSRHVAYCKPGDKGWTHLYNEGSMDTPLYYKDRFYFVSYLGSLFTWDPHSLVFSEIISRDKLLGHCGGVDVKYLVEIRGELFMIVRYRGNKGEYGYTTQRFVVYKVCLDEHKLIRMKSIGSYAVFVGLNTAFSVSALEFPGCRGNCIYFTDDYIDAYHGRILYGTGEGPQDFGVFNMDDGIIEQYYTMESDMIFPPPVWVEPSLRDFSTTEEPVFPIEQSIVGAGSVS